MEEKSGLPNNLSRFLAPETVFIDITPYCNLRCNHCYLISYNNKHHEQSYEKVCNILDQLYKAGVFKVALVGREPLMRTDLEKVFQYALSKKFVLKIATNGTLLTNEIARLFADYNINSVQVSIDSISPQKHNKFRGSEKAFEKTIKGVELLRKYNIKTCIATTLTNFNFFEIEEIIGLSYKLGAYHYRARLLISNDHNKSYQITKAQYKQTVKALFDLKGRDNFTIEQLHHSFLFDNSKEYNVERNISIPCGAGIYRCSLTEDFKITPCIALAQLYSSRMETFFIDEWQNNNVFKEWLLTFNNIKGKCKICGYRYFCGGGCRANVFGITNDIYSSDPWCWFNPQEV